MTSCSANVGKQVLSDVCCWASAQVPDGFILKENRHDSLPLDDFFSGKQINGNSKKSLEKAGYLGYLGSRGCNSYVVSLIRRQELHSRW